MVKATFEYWGDNGYIMIFDYIPRDGSPAQGRQILCYVFKSEEKGVRDERGVWRPDEPKLTVWIDPKHSSVEDLKFFKPIDSENNPDPDVMKYRYEIEFEPRTDRDGKPSNSFITNADGTDKDKGITVIDKSAKTVLTEEQKEKRQQQEIMELKIGIQSWEWAIRNGDNGSEARNNLAKLKSRLAELENNNTEREREREREQKWI